MLSTEKVERPPLALVSDGTNGCIKPTKSIKEQPRAFSNTRLRVRQVTSSNPLMARLILLFPFNVFQVINFDSILSSNLENSLHRFRALFFFKNRPLFDAFDQKSVADIFHWNAGAALGGDPVLDVRQQRAFHASWDQQFFVAYFPCGGDGEFGGGHGDFRFFLKGTDSVQRGHSTHSLRAWLTLLASTPASAPVPAK